MEGLRSVEDTVKYGTVKQLFVLQENKVTSMRQAAVVEQAALAGAELYAVTEQVMKKLPIQKRRSR
ncbi:MAG: hypothetical protein LUC29_01020 [Acidaminococcaceae bacterium]|nr:hypothetical protein [Acidaminococcaceae bacterium]